MSLPWYIPLIKIFFVNVSNSYTVSKITNAKPRKKTVNILILLLCLLVGFIYALIRIKTNIFTASACRKNMIGWQSCLKGSVNPIGIRIKNRILTVPPSIDHFLRKQFRKIRILVTLIHIFHVICIIGNRFKSLVNRLKRHISVII